MYQEINLYQPIFRKQRQIFSAATLAQAAVIVGAALLAFYAYGLWQVRGLERQVMHLETREKALMTQLSSIDPTLAGNRRGAVEEEVRGLAAQLAEQQRLIEVLREHPLGSTRGFSPYLAALGREHTADLWLTSIVVDGGSGALELAGRSVRADAVPEYLQHLGRETALAGQRFDRLEIERDEHDGQVRFRATSRKAGTDKGQASIASQSR